MCACSCACCLNCGVVASGTSRDLGGLLQPCAWRRKMELCSACASPCAPDELGPARSAPVVFLLVVFPSSLLLHIGLQRLRQILAQLAQVGLCDRRGQQLVRLLDVPHSQIGGADA